jgi:hypothetical protein
MPKQFGDSFPRYDQSGFTTKSPLGPNQTNFEISGNKISHTDISNWLNTSFKTSGIKTDFKLNQKESKLNIDMQNQKYVFSSLLDDLFLMTFALINYRKQRHLEAILDVRLPDSNQRKTKILFNIKFDDNKTEQAMLALRKYIVADKALVKMVEPIIDNSQETDEKFVSRINELKKKINKVIQENKNNDGFNLRSNN